MASTYVLIEAKTLSSTQTSITFSSIPQTYTDLVLKMSSRLTSANVDNTITLNGSSTKSYGLRMYGNGSNSSSDNAAGGGLANSSGYTASVFSNTEYYIPDYTGSKNKNISIDAVTENNDTQAYQNFSSQVFTLTSGITSIQLTPVSGSYAIGSTFYLYGIKNS
jgi:hypothetical protein